MSQDTKWRYGDSWEKYPIADGQTWTHPASGSAVTVHDIRDPLPEHMRGVDLLYADPPWNQGNVNTFVTKAGLTRRVASFAEFVAALAAAIDTIAPRVCYLEAGKQHVEDVAAMLGARWPRVDRWPIRYYRRHACWLLRAGADAPPRAYTGMDDALTPLAAIQAEGPASVADCCTGRGLTLLAAHQCGLPFHGTELNRRRLAVALEGAAAIGWEYRS
jgi:hypothetical protein